VGPWQHFFLQCGSAGRCDAYGVYPRCDNSGSWTRVSVETHSPEYPPPTPPPTPWGSTAYYISKAEVLVEGGSMIPGPSSS